DGRKVIMIGSNNYLGLTNNPYVKEQSIKAIEKYGTSCTGSRFLNGTIELHEELERRLAKFMQKEACIVFSTGFQANLGAISALVGKDDYVVIDRANHASIIDACRLSFGETVKYKHNDMEDLERIVKKIKEEKPDAGILIVSDGVFSMEGDLVNLARLIEIKEKYKTRIFIDDAHGIGVLGRNGRGVCEHFNLLDKVDLIMGTFSKSFASLGGFVAGEKAVIEYIKHFARSLIFSASMPPAQIAAVLASLDIIEKEPQRREKLKYIIRRITKEYLNLGLSVPQNESAIIPIILGNDQLVFTFWKLLLENGVYVNPIISPAVTPDRALLRTSYMATHTDEHIDKVVNAFKKVLSQIPVLKKNI
ncbi:MAG: aminotransferase class I/II-fold pyridoxal phosphate-dependent enzyme, partial [Planctomycetota bacterium]